MARPQARTDAARVAVTMFCLENQWSLEPIQCRFGRACSSSRQRSPVRLAMTVERIERQSSLPSNGNTQGGSRKAACNA